MVMFRNKAGQYIALVQVQKGAKSWIDDLAQDTSGKAHSRLVFCAFFDTIMSSKESPPTLICMVQAWELEFVYFWFQVAPAPLDDFEAPNVMCLTVPY